MELINIFSHKISLVTRIVPIQQPICRLDSKKESEVCRQVQHFFNQDLIELAHNA